MNTLPRRRSRFPTLLCGLLTATAACLAAMPAAGQVAPQPHDTAVKPPMDPERATIDFIGGTSLKAYPYAYYTPETHLAFGGGASLSWRLRELGPDQQPGSVLAAVTYTTRSQLIVALDPEFTTRDGQWLVDPYFGFKDYPDKFWGIGPEAPASAEEDFTPRILDIQLGAQKSLGGAWRAGPSYVLMKYEPGDLEQQGQLAAGTVPGAEGGISSGLGAVVAYDSRDKRFSAERGIFAQLQLRAFGSLLGSDHTFEQVILDLRHYRTLKPGVVLAVQAYSQSTGGEPPFNMMAMVGGSSRLRGYWTGRYRDRQAVVVQGELRAHVKGRLGVAAFAGVGGVGDTYGRMHLDQLHPSLGAGLRWLFDPEANIKLRLDFARGDAGQSGTYITVMEAF